MEYFQNEDPLLQRAKLKGSKKCKITTISKIDCNTFIVDAL